MPITTEIIDDIVYNAADGKTTSWELGDYIAHHACEWAHHGVLWNLCDVSWSRMTAHSVREIKALVEKTRSMPIGIKTAILVDTLVGFGLSRMYQLLTDENGKYFIKVFRVQAEAIAWLREE
jgi:hypothetical protein